MADYWITFGVQPTRIGVLTGPGQIAGSGR